MKHKLTASMLRIILIIILILLIAGGVTGFIFLRDALVKQAQEAAKISAEALSSQDKLQNLKDAQAMLAANEDVEQKVSRMLATSIQYTYQDEIIRELKKLGDSAGVKVTNIDFMSTTPVTTPTPTNPSTAAQPDGATTGTPAQGTSIPSNVKLTQANITISTPLRYDNLLRFIRFVEQNTMTMKVSKLGLSSAGESEGDQILVNCDVLTVGVYTR